jgi:hypothetical protein
MLKSKLKVSHSDLGFLKKIVPEFTSTPLEKGLNQTLNYLS